MLEAEASALRIKVHFADRLGLVAGFAGQTKGQAPLVRDGTARTAHIVVRQAVLASGETSKHGRALRHADRAIGIGAPVPNALPGDLIKMRRQHRMGAIGDAEAIPTPLIQHDVNDVGFFAG